MVFVNKSLEQMMEEIKFNRIIFFDFWSPMEHKERWHFSAIEYEFGIDLVTNVQTKYVNQNLEEHIPETQNSINYSNKWNQLFTMVGLALENALTRGHEMFYALSKKESDDLIKGLSELPSKCFTNIDLPISIKIFSGEEGYIVRVRDSGKGFSYQECIQKKRNGEHYGKTFGTGLRVMDEPGIEISYEGTGSVINIMILK